jgi:tripartite ATP-independent transporter DctM subunit
MDSTLMTAVLFLVMVALLLTGMPLGFLLGFIGLIFTYVFWGTPAIMQIASAAFGPTLNIILIAIPLFIFMANVLQFSGMADGLYEMFYKWSGGLRGGLAIGTVAICAIFAAMSGVSGAATVSMGVIALPSMLKRGYDKYMSVGAIAAGGALGILIPPSVPMVIYAAFSSVSVGKLFVAGVLPGLLMSGMFMIYVFIRCLLNPKMGPAIPIEARASWGEKFKATRSVILPILLVAAVCGSIFMGLATPTEAAAVGCIGSLVCAGVNRKLTRAAFKEASLQTIQLSTMIIWIVIGSTCFSNIYSAVGAGDFLNNLVIKLELGRWVVLFIIQCTFFVLGCFMDPTGIIMITTPIFLPIVTQLGFDPIWFGVLFIINMEMGYLTPPFGYNLFYMRSVVPEQIMSMQEIYRSVLPFIVIQGLCLIIVAIFPEIALWLPSMMKLK